MVARRRRPRRALRHRRLPPVRPVLDARRRLPRAGRGAARPRDERHGDVREHRRRRPRPRRRRRRLARLLERSATTRRGRGRRSRRSSTSTDLYDALFYRPSVATAKLLYALVEGPLVGGSLTGITVRHRPARRLRPRAADGHRAHVRPRRRGRARRHRPRLHLGVVPLMGSWVTTALIVLPAARALVALAAALAARSGRGRRPRRLASPRSASGSRRWPTSTSPRQAARSSTRSRRRGSASSASRTTSASSASGSGWQASPSSCRRRPSPTRCASAATGRARTTG